MHIKLNPRNTTAANLAKTEKIFKEYNPQYPFEYVFADEAYAKKFNDTQRTGKLAALFAALTIFISCLGLFALAAYMAENRTKEIGVRKVLGASVINITSLLSKDFLKLVIISFVIASPVAWFAMSEWLKSYSYRISIAVVGFCCCRFTCAIYSIDHNKFSINKSSNGKSGEQPSLGMSCCQESLRTE